MKKLVLIALFWLPQMLAAQSQYNSNAGISRAEKNVQRDNFGNASSDDYDLAKKDAFKETEYNFVKKSEIKNMPAPQSYEAKVSGVPVNYKPRSEGKFTASTILVIQLYTGEGFDFVAPTKALEDKGFSIYCYKDYPPSPKELEKALSMSTQLWVISDSKRKLSDDHVQVIKDYFDKGHGVYIWGDNEPYYADANVLSQALIGTTMLGNVMGDKIVKLKEKDTKVGLVPNHLITTGLENVYEGVTIATVQDNKDVKPLMYGSAGNVVTAVYEKNGKRCILDGGFTRLFIKWDTAGTDRYVKNAAAWLVNVEKFAQK